MKFGSITFISVLVATFLLTVLISKRLIPVLKSHKMGQKILEIGPRWHKNKEGTPTMGGLSFIIASVITGAVAITSIAVRDGLRSMMPLVMTLSLGVACGLIGCIDDRAKLRKKQNEGLTAPQKYLIQLAAAGLYLFGMSFSCDMTTEVYIPYADCTVDLGIWFYVFAVILLTGVINSVNLTDGIDGLASSVVIVIGMFYAAASFFGRDAVNIDMVILSALMIGGAAGFLVYNFYPARVFMGDTGSLFLGGLVVGGAFIMNNPLIVIIAGFILVLEVVSVILQVGYFKLTHGKRLFKMAPIHHHYEKCGWSEVKIVTVFTIVTALCCAAAWFGL